MSTKKYECCGFLLGAKPLQAGQLAAVGPVKYRCGLGPAPPAPRGNRNANALGRSQACSVENWRGTRSTCSRCFQVQQALQVLPRPTGGRDGKRGGREESLFYG